ncbi:MAG: CRISPR-associated endonuclease Cas1, partial [Thiotrichales bacterium]|nr:CRISPR-associated endonuclease Cas1 [Thiotrichales bacterium]
ETQKHHFAAHKVKTILLATSAALSTDAVQLAMMNNIDIVFVNYNGQPYGRIWHSKLGSTTRIRKAQLEISLNEEGLKWIKIWLNAKIEYRKDFLLDLKKHRPRQKASIEEGIDKIEEQHKKIGQISASNVGEVADTLRGLEGTAGRYYFDLLSRLLPNQYQFNGRSYRPAMDAFNAFLNYAYGMLYGKVEKALMIAGLDPYLGLLHRDDYNHLSLVYDFIEPYRIHVERPVYRLFSGKKVKQEHTTIMTKGISLNAEGKALLIERFNKYFEEEKVRYNNRNLTRAHGMQLDAHRFANQLIEK